MCFIHEQSEQQITYFFLFQWKQKFMNSNFWGKRLNESISIHGKKTIIFDWKIAIEMRINWEKQILQLVKWKCWFESFL